MERSVPPTPPPGQAETLDESASSPLDRVALHNYLRAALAPQVIPYDLAVISPPAALRRRFRPYSMVMPHLSAEPWTLGYDELTKFKAIVVVVLFTDVAVDYYIRRDLMPRFRERIAMDHGENALGSDHYLVARKEIAVLARLGRIGRNSLFFSRKFGFNCKIDLACLNVPVRDAASIADAPRAPLLGACESCDICIAACPVSAYSDFNMTDPLACEKHITPDWEHPERMCRACVESCPVSRTMLKRRHVDYETPFAIHESSRRTTSMFRRNVEIEWTEGFDGPIVRGADFEIALPTEAEKAISFLKHQMGPFSLVALRYASPALSLPALERLVSVLIEVGAIETLGKADA